MAVIDSRLPQYFGQSITLAMATVVTFSALLIVGGLPFFVFGSLLVLFFYQGM
jgi:hypothetical protein